MSQTQLDLTSQVKGILPTANGGTGGTSVLPAQTGYGGYFLQTNGTNASWQNLMDGGTF
jgi:hypothetical protein